MHLDDLGDRLSILCFWQLIFRCFIGVYCLIASCVIVYETHPSPYQDVAYPTKEFQEFKSIASAKAFLQAQCIDLTSVHPFGKEY